MSAQALHIPVLITQIIEACGPISGRWLDGTFGAGGYTRALLDAGAQHVYAIDRDPSVFEWAAAWIGPFSDRITPICAPFSRMYDYAQDLDGVVLDLGVSSMQLDQAQRGFSFAHDGPLDMRMGSDGVCAADLVNDLPEAELADILWCYGEERASRRIARAILKARPILRTGQLATVISSVLPRAKPGKSHPATRSFQALRIAVNDEFGELYRGLSAAERALRPGGKLAVVTFHSLEDRMVKRFFSMRSGAKANANRYAPEQVKAAAQFEDIMRRAISPGTEEIAVNPRARSARLRAGLRTLVPSGAIAPEDIAMPILPRRRSR